MSDRKLQNAQRSERQATIAPEQNQNHPPDLSKQQQGQGQGYGFGISIDMSSNTAEEAADRALSSVARKLDKSLSVEYMVNQLIAEATDPSNLAKIFAGEWLLLLLLFLRLMMSVQVGLLISNRLFVGLLFFCFFDS